MDTDIPSAMEIKNVEGWNQVEADWKLMMKTSPEFCLVAEVGADVIGTITAINYGNKIAWIGMMLVRKEYRGLGISKRLMKTVLEKLKGVETVKLDATPTGLKVYEKIGFSSESAISRMILKTKNVFTADRDGIAVQGISLEDHDNIVAYDAKVFGANREHLINMILSSNPGLGIICKMGNQVDGFALARQGTFYHHIGPVYANDEITAQAIISTCIETIKDRPIIMDVVDTKKSFIQWLKSTGFEKARPLIRMSYNTKNPHGMDKAEFCICGPEYG